MPENVFQTLQRLLADPRRFFPTSTAPEPLLILLNTEDIKTPEFPLSIPALKDLLVALGMEQLKALDASLFAAIKGGDPGEVLQQMKAIVGQLPLLAQQAEALVAEQIIVGASLLSILQALDPLNDRNLLTSIFTAQGEYFFNGGYLTVADEKIIPPSLATADPKAVFSEKTGERYIRDLTRVGIEALANDTWKLIERYKSMSKDPKIKDTGKAQKWFKGFADYAEASVTSVIEQVLSQGGGVGATIPTNPLVAAAIATAAGTAARKAAQQTFLEEIGID